LHLVKFGLSRARSSCDEWRCKYDGKGYQGNPGDLADSRIPVSVSGLCDYDPGAHRSGASLLPETGASKFGSLLEKRVHIRRSGAPAGLGL
jgi:hypothetical protein